jgi:hypothetical protein
MNLEWVDELVERTARRNEARARRLLRPEHLKRSPRCPVCGGFLSTGPTRFEGGVEGHRACFGDGQR